MRGVMIDMDAMRAQNEEARAIGNAKMNARGDVLGQNGQIEVRREQIARDYYNSNPQAAKQVSLKPAVPDVFETPEQAVARLTGKAEAPTAETDTPEGLAPRKGRRLLNNSND
jgi:hypothetical protein